MFLKFIKQNKVFLVIGFLCSAIVIPMIVNISSALLTDYIKSNTQNDSVVNDTNMQSASDQTKLKSNDTNAKRTIPARDTPDDFYPLPSRSTDREVIKGHLQVHNNNDVPSKSSKTQEITSRISKIQLTNEMPLAETKAVSKIANEGIRLNIFQGCDGFMRFDPIKLKNAIENKLDKKRAIPLGALITINMVAGYSRENFKYDPGTTIRAYAAFVLNEGLDSQNPPKLPSAPCANTVPYADQDILSKNVDSALDDIASKVADCIKNKCMEGALL